MNKYRVDTNNSKTVPCGMNSILYIGDNWQQACNAFDNAKVGFDWWDKPNNLYGVVLSVWNDQKRDYVIKKVKGLK